MKVELRKSALKDLERLDKKVKEQIIESLKSLYNFPDIHGCKKLVNFEPAYRLRSGDYRVLFDVFEDSLFVARIMHRKDCYRK
jgi:mRNA interferase RelE/StbE